MKRSLAGLTAVFAMVFAGLVAATPGASAATMPQAVPGGPYSTFLGNAIQFDGTASTGDAPLSYLWMFGDGTTAAGAQPVKVYSSPGTFTVTLTVTDISGNQSTATTTATVLSVASVMTSGCSMTSDGMLVCAPTAASVIASCEFSVTGDVCQQANFIIPSEVGALTPSEIGVITPTGVDALTPIVVPSTTVVQSNANTVCGDPNLQLTPLCLDS